MDIALRFNRVSEFVDIVLITSRLANFAPPRDTQRMTRLGEALKQSYRYP